MLYIFVEGDDDERFFNAVLLPRLRRKYESIKIIKYAQKPKKFEFIEKFIRSIQTMECDYIYVTDIDNSTCETGKKQEIKEKVRNINADMIFVVIKEIESWYLAGLDENSCEELKIKNFSATDDITKEQFNNLIPKKFSSRIDFMIEILKRFSVEVAKTKNKSFRYFANKYQI